MAVVLTPTQLDHVLRDVPGRWHDDPDHVHHVIFLAPSADAAQLLSGIEGDPDLEQVIPAGGHIYWAIRNDGVSRSALSKLGRMTDYQHVTVRTLRTLERLQQLMRDQNWPRR